MNATGDSASGVFPYDGVVWDWNGTLLDDVAMCVDVMNGLLAARGLATIEVARYRRMFRFPVVEYYRDLGFDFARESFERVGREFVDRYELRRLECPLRDGARETLEAVRARGVRQAIVSAYHQDRLGTLVRHFRLENLFDGVVGGGDDYAHGKIDRARRWMRDHGWPEGARLLVIGDTDHDAEVAREIGADCWLLCGGHQDEDRLRRCGVPVYDRLSALPFGRGSGMTGFLAPDVLR